MMFHPQLLQGLPHGEKTIRDFLIIILFKRSVVVVYWSEVVLMTIHPQLLQGLLHAPLEIVRNSNNYIHKLKLFNYFLHKLKLFERSAAMVYWSEVVLTMIHLPLLQSLLPPYMNIF